jgi:heat shock protein HtpX
MNRHRVIPHDDLEAHPELKRVIPPDDPKYPAIRRRLMITWCKTLAGYGMMTALLFIALYAVGFKFHLTWMGAVWTFVLPIVLWWNCARIALWMQKAVPADPTNPSHKMVQECVDEVFAESGMQFKPPLYYSPNPLPNAFATGPIHRKAVVAFTEGLLHCGMTRDEIKAVFAHELGHVRNYDVAINSFLGIISSLFFMVINSGVSAFMLVSKPVQWLAEQIKLGWVWKILTNVVWYVVFQAVSQVTKVIQMFVVRSRESGADATGAYITGKPCDLANALRKLVCAFKKQQRPGFGEDGWLEALRNIEMVRALRPLMTADPLFDSLEEEPKPSGIWGRIKALWKYLQLTHPPVPERVAELERMNGGSCPWGGCE